VTDIQIALILAGCIVFFGLYVVLCDRVSDENSRHRVRVAAARS